MYQHRPGAHVPRASGLRDMGGCRLAANTERARENREYVRRLLKKKQQPECAGYDKAAAVAHQANDQGTTLRQAALATGYISAADFDHIVNPAAMTSLSDARTARKVVQ
jgi:fumarate hydratase class II